VDVDCAAIGRSAAEVREPVHLLLDRKDLFAAASAFCLRQCGLQHVDKLNVVVLAKSVQKFLCRRCQSPSHSKCQLSTYGSRNCQNCL
jgi:hypothetical protein